MKIAICDDSSLFRTQVLGMASDYAEERKDTAVTVQAFSDGESLLRAVRETGGFDVYLLDIVMPGMDGIELGQALRQTGTAGKLVYLTSSEEFALASYRVRAFDYLIKPIRRETLFAVLDEAIGSIPVKPDKVLIVKTKETNTRISFDSILYAELRKRAIVYHLAGGNTVTSTTLRTTFSEAVAELLADSRFVLCGASMAANMHHITMVESEAVIFMDADTVFLGKRACRKLRGDWNNYWITREGAENRC